MPQMKNELGQFTSKSGEERSVRSIRATDTVWNVFGVVAENRGITRADLLELMVESKGFELSETPCNTTVDANRIREILEEALTFKSNAGGAIKAKIREVLELL